MTRVQMRVPLSDTADLIVDRDYDFHANVGGWYVMTVGGNLVVTDSLQPGMATSEVLRLPLKEDKGK